MRWLEEPPPLPPPQAPPPPPPTPPPPPLPGISRLDRTSRHTQLPPIVAAAPRPAAVPPPSRPPPRSSASLSPGRPPDAAVGDAAAAAYAEAHRTSLREVFREGREGVLLGGSLRVERLAGINFPGPRLPSRSQAREPPQVYPTQAAFATNLLRLQLARASPTPRLRLRPGSGPAAAARLRGFADRSEILGLPGQLIQGSGSEAILPSMTRMC